MSTLKWLEEHRLENVLHREHDWVFSFDGQVVLVVSCLWRLLEAGRIRLTSEDDGQQFGLPAPIIAAEEVNERIGKSAIESVVLQPHTLDLELRFATGHVLQVIPDSGGYESWIASIGDTNYIAVGGGELVMRDTMNPSTLCPICGYDLRILPWVGESASDEICPSCGIQFGYDDSAGGDPAQRLELYNEWRRRWIENGMTWSSSQPPPKDWSPEEQLRRVTG